MIDSLFIGNRDGGIVNTFSQVPSSSEPVVIIGLGGTGVDAISILKTKLQRQIKPDNEEDVTEKGEESKYKHIKFLGIDADKGWLQSSGLTQAETLNIQNYNYNTIFAPNKLDALKSQKELQWMSIDYISQHLPPHPDGAGAYRQFGRWLTIASANNIKTRITEVINQACTGLEGNRLNVHIVSGISGGMGGGSFADVCYITRKVLDDLGFYAAKVFGYFVLPDANISKQGIIGNPVKSAHIQKNGIASLLEIEHLMNLWDSNEWFEQDYGSFQIKTQLKFVDFCHFVSATNMNGVLVEKGYEYALNVISDYILAFLSEEEVADGAAPISMISLHVCEMQSLSGIIQNYGCSQNYNLIGCTAGEIPKTQMATYLATQLFKNLTISRQIPSSTQIQQEFVDYLKLSDSRFKELENQITQGAEWNHVTYDLVRQYFDQIKAHMNDNVLPNAMINLVESSIKQRKGLLIQKRESMEKEVDSYTYEAGASSIPGLALNKLIEIVEDPTKGPIYAYGMMNTAGADIFHYLDSRLRYYASQKYHAEDQEASFMNLEPVSKRNLGTSNIFSRKRNIKEYASTLNSIFYWEAMADVYEQMEILIANLISALRDINKRYLKPLYETTMELIDTFEANSSYFEMGKGDESQDGFTKQLVKFSRIQPQLDAEVTELDPRNETNGLLKILTRYPDIWMEHDELKLRAKISEYVLQKFDPILSGSIESFLRKDLNMENAPEAAFANVIQSQIINPLVDDAAPIFWTSESLVSDDTKTLHRLTLTVPNADNCICLTADQLKKRNSLIDVRKSLINDKVYALRTIGGVPMFAYDGLVHYFDSYDNYLDLGLHLYERNVNWRETLTFPYPYSLDPKYTKNADELLKLYDEAEDEGIIYYENNMAFVKQYKDIDPELLNVDSLMNEGKLNIEKANQRISALEAVLNVPVNKIPINSKGNRAGNRVVIDNFLRFYGIQQAMKKEVEKYDCIVKSIEEIKEALNNN